MYYPYLRGRQFELLALRECAKEISERNKILPIIEPVKIRFSSMNLCLKEFVKNDVRFALIMNPQVGEIFKDKNIAPGGKSKFILESIDESIRDYENMIPALILSDNYEEVETFINGQSKEVMLIIAKGTNVKTDEFSRFFSGNESKISHVVYSENRNTKRFFSGKSVQQIRIDDNFVQLQRNSDYSDRKEELFTEEHLYYKEDGFDGFADYTTISGEFTEGGMTPYVVVIHFTYDRGESGIWIKHFASVTGLDNRVNIRGKFGESLTKLIRFVEEEKIDNDAVRELKKYHRDERYPGLGMVKKISIKNHLELINTIL